MKCRSSPEGRFIEDMGYPSGSETAKAIRNRQLIKWSVLPTSRSASGVRRAVVYFKSSSEQVQFSSNCFNMRICGSKAGESLCRSYLKLVTPRKMVECGFSCEVFGLQVSIGVAGLQSWVEGCRM